MEHKQGCVEVWEEQITLPTYGVGAPDKNPMFLEKRVYQGSSGKVYPYPVIDKIYDEKIDKDYKAVWLENDYIRVMILPELGGRIQRAYDKTNGYDFVYYNEVIKPALVGLTGPWISGGIEFNWPQHHRPTTYSPVDYILTEQADGSKTVQVSEVDQMYGTKGMASFTLHPGRAYIEIRGQLYNRTPLPQTFLWWANPAVAVNDDTQSIFPPDVTAVMDHGKRDVSKFPIATGVYYKHNYGAGVDISRYKNIPVPTSYMAYHSEYDFVGGFDYGKGAGILHVADHHVSPGKKQWTWGCGDFGQAWDRNLTDENGPYIELMTGMFTDNQPDFTWLKPFEEKTFTQYFMPYKKVGKVKNASTEVVLGLETEECGKARICVYATAVYENARIVLSQGDNIVYEKICTISPVDILEDTIDAGEISAHEMTLSVYDEKERKMLSYTPAAPKLEKIPAPAEPLPEPEKLSNCEELYLAATHLEQYRHATFRPEDYYQEALKRDPGDIRCNNGYGMLLLRQGCFNEAEKHFRAAVKRATWKNAQPYDGEPYYNLGLALYYQKQYEKALDAFMKAAWTSAQQEMALYYVAVIQAKAGDDIEALGHIERALVKNSHSLKALGVKAVLLRRNGKGQEAKALCEQTLSLDPFAYMAGAEYVLHHGGEKQELLKKMRNNPNAFLETAADYAELGEYSDALAVLKWCTADVPMIKYYEAYYLAACGKDFMPALTEAESCSPLYCFPNKLEDIEVLDFAMRYAPQDALAAYYLGNLYYDKRQYKKACDLWERSVQLNRDFPTAWRNLAIVYFNKMNLPEKALEALETAYRLDPTDARVFLELDQLHKKLGWMPERRIAVYEQHKDVFIQRDDLITEYVTLLNLLGRHEDAYRVIMSHKFHPWEGGEGKITSQYVFSLREMAKSALKNGDAKKAKELLTQAQAFPHNLGEGKLEGRRDNDLYYYLGLAAKSLGDTTAAKQYFAYAILGDMEPAGMMYYNDQPADMILYQGLALRELGYEEDALSRFHKLVDYGEKHVFDEVKIDYFAVSLPDLQLFDADLNIRNRAHCLYLIALGSYGLGDYARAYKACLETLSLDPSHIGAALHTELFQKY